MEERRAVTEEDKQRTQSNIEDVQKKQEQTQAGQRRVNLLWELVQAGIAISVVGTSLFVAASLAMMVIKPESTERQISNGSTAFMLMSNLASLVIGFYFGRTNHQKVGGVGSHEEGR